MDLLHLSFVPKWAPAWLIALTALAVIAIVTAIFFGVIRRILRRFLPDKTTLQYTVMQHTAGLAQFAFTVLVVALVTPLLPLDRGTNHVIGRLLIAAFIVLAGWIAIVATNLAINRYVSRFHSGTASNLAARKVITQMRLLKRTIDVVIAVITAGFALMTFDAVRQFGVSLFASAGIAGLAIGLAAKPLLENLIAGIQLAITQPFRIDDVVIVNGEWGWIEEINSTYVVVRIWDLRRLVVPLSYMMTTPFENWSRQAPQLLGTVYVYTDFAADVGRIRAKAAELVKASPLWDGKVFNVLVTDVSESSMTMQVRIVASARNSSDVWDMRCALREQILDYLRTDYPESLPRRRNQIVNDEKPPLPQT